MSRGTLLACGCCVDDGFVGDGSYSSVYKVKRLEDGLIYALKKVKI